MISTHLCEGPGTLSAPFPQESWPVQSFPHKLLSSSGPLSEVSGLHPKLTGKKRVGKPTPHSPVSFCSPRPALASWLLGEGQGSSDPQAPCRSSRKHSHTRHTNTHTLAHTRSHTHTDTPRRSNLKAPRLATRGVNLTHIDSDSATCQPAHPPSHGEKGHCAGGGVIPPPRQGEGRSTLFLSRSSEPVPAGTSEAGVTAPAARRTRQRPALPYPAWTQPDMRCLPGARWVATWPRERQRVRITRELCSRSLFLALKRRRCQETGVGERDGGES